MNKKRERSLSAQLFCGVLLSLLAGVLVFMGMLTASSQLLEHTVYGRSFTVRVAAQKFDDLQNYVLENQIGCSDLNRITAWSSRWNKLYLVLYQDDTLLYESPTTGTLGAMMSLDASQIVADAEYADQEHTLMLSDGVTVSAFLDYYAGDIFYFAAATVSGLLAFFAFSLCFVLMVHRKLAYLKQLKRELDILAGGDLNYPVTVRGTDELGELAFGIDQMRRSILAHQNAEDQMRSANSQLVTAMSHDLRTPLTSLLAYLELMDRRKYESPEQLQHFIHRSLEQTLRIKSMADKLFEYFLAYASEWEQPEMEIIDADELFQQVWSECAFSLESGGFSVETSFESLGRNLQVSLELLRRAFDNLYSNLLKYADPAHPVVLSYCREGQQVHLLLRNHIAPQRNAHESTNIGLNTCRRIIQYHGGSFASTQRSGVFQVDILLPLLEK